MKKYIFWLCIIFKSALAQPNITWHKFFDSSYSFNSYGVNIVELEDSSYSFLSYYHNKQLLIHLTNFGDTVWTKTFHTNLFLRSFIKTNDGGYAMLGAINNWMLIKTDSMGDTLWTKPYPQLPDPRCLIQTSDGGYAIGSYNGAWDMIKTDSFGTIQWQSAAASLHVQGVLECYNKHYLVYGNSGFNPFCYQAGLVDSLGNLKWVNYYGNVTYLGADLESIVSAVQLPDSSFILGCSIDTTTQGQYSLLKVKYADGVLTDSVKLTDIMQYDYSMLELLSDGNILIRARGYIHKTTPSYVSIWKKILPFFVTSVKQTIDNGFIATGGNVFQQTNLSRVEYAKLDSLGNIYNFQSVPELAVNELRVHPNPASHQLTINHLQLTIGQPVTVTVYDVMGKVHLQQTQTAQGDVKVELNTLPSGMYVLQLQQADRLFTGRFVKE